MAGQGKVTIKGGEMKEKRSKTELSIHSMELYRRLIKCEKGEFIPYSELSDIIGMDIQKEGYCYGYRAREMALRNDGLRFEAVSKEGFKCLTDEENAMITGPFEVKKLSRMTRKGIQKVTAIDDYGKLSNEAKRNHNFGLSVLGVVRYTTKPKRLKRIMAEVSKKPRELSFDSTIRLFES